MLVRGNWFFLLLSILATTFMAKPYIYVIQQDNYRLKGIFKSKNIRTAYFMDLVSVLVFGGIYFGVSFLHSRVFWGFLTAMFFFIAETVLYFAEDGDKKKPLKYTKRAVRGFVSVAVVESALIVGTLFYLNGLLGGDDAFYRYAGFFIFPVFYPLVFLLTMSVVNVFERLNNLRYEKKTRAILSRSDCIKIAITGSYGKTSVKNYLKDLLEIKYRVLATPESFNTPMGISKTVKDLDMSHEVFIAEMGARRVGDIKKLMKIVNPDVAVLTGINSQHLETFKSQKNIVDEKMRVITDLKKDGFAVVNNNLIKIVEDKQNKILANVNFAGSGGEVWASDVALSKRGSEFNLHFGDEVHRARTGLIGEHNVENLAVASAVAFALGINPKHIVERIAHVEPVPHRLQLIVRDGMTIIDDTFNSNPDGARKALDTLSQFEGRKVVVTPGLVELGDLEEEENYALGKKIAMVADTVVLIGKRGEQVARGLSDFDGKILCFNTLAEAQKSFKDFLHIGDNLLLLNDLPDIYED